MNVKWMVLVGLVAVLAHGADPLPDTVAAYRGRYEALKGRLDGKRDAAIGKAVGVYRGELELLLTNVRQQGKLDYVVAIQAELKRLETDPTAPKKPAARPMMHLRRAQGGARVAEDQAVDVHGKGLAKLRKGYSSSLRSLEKRLVAANEIAEAKLARAEREKIPKPVKKGKAEPREKPKEKPVPRLARKPVTNTIEGLIDGNTYLNIFEDGIQWACRLNIEVVGKRGHRKAKPTLVNGKRWKPKWGDPIKEHNIRKSEVYKLAGLDGPITVTVLAKRKGAKPETLTKRMILIRDPQPGACWYVFTITQGG
jgi:hypothetical protein